MPVCGGHAQLPGQTRLTQFRGMVGSARIPPACVCDPAHGGDFGEPFLEGGRGGGLPQLSPLPEQAPRWRPSMEASWQVPA